jgi:DNA-binding winged helix-turn-helix (wHTH) protein
MSSEQHRLFPPFRLDLENTQLWRDGYEISLRRKTFEVLCFLVDHPRQLATKQMLLDAVWPDVSVSDNLPATCIAELRRALDEDSENPRFIETVHGPGYRFIAPVTLGTSQKPKPKASTVAVNNSKPQIVGREA